MDPDANLRELLRLAAKDGDLDMDQAFRLCELVTALDEWITKGGFLPARWRLRPTEFSNG